LPFVNADIIAKELAEKGKPVADYEAARLAEQKRQEYVSESGTVSAGRDVRGRRTPPTVSAAPTLGAFHIV